MHDPENRERGGGPPRPFVAGESHPAPVAPQVRAGIPRPFIPGEDPETSSAEPVQEALPAITEFLYEERPAGSPRVHTPSVPPIPGYNTPAATPAANLSATPPEPWATGEWQHYDWRAAAALAPDDSARAEQAWSDLDWDDDARRMSRDRAEAVAAALEQVARQIRAGHLSVRGQPGMSEEAAVAAALTALLAIRR